MSSGNSNSTPSDTNVQKSCRKETCGCGFRKCRCVFLLLLVLIVVGASVGYWWFFGRIHGLDVYKKSMQKIQADKSMQEALGTPIEVVNWPPRTAAPSARVDDQEIDIRWPIHGPKASGQAHVLVQRRMGEWQTIMLEVTLPGSKRIAIHDASDTGEDAPLFNQGPKPDEKKPEANASAPDINLQIPDGVPEPEKK
jgi:hypothetical protein